MITLYQFEVSPFCDKVRRILHWKKQPYAVREVPMKAAFTAIKKVNPIGKLPCLEHDALSLADLSVFAEFACIRDTEEGGRAFETRPSVAAWMARVAAATAKPA
jgi:glutathione S-transferase